MALNMLACALSATPVQHSSIVSPVQGQHLRCMGMGMGCTIIASCLLPSAGSLAEITLVQVTLGTSGTPGRGAVEPDAHACYTLPAAA